MAISPEFHKDFVRYACQNILAQAYFSQEAMIMKHILFSFFGIAILMLFGCGTAAQQLSPIQTVPEETAQISETVSQPIANTTPINKNDKKPDPSKDAQPYSLEQAISDNAQLHTIAFSALAFMTGNSGADSFFPPGKVADYFGFQYMRDVDVAGYGHNTQFLSRVANNVLSILTDDQLEALRTLAAEQAPLYEGFAYNRFPLMAAFRASLEGNMPAGTSALDQDRVAAYCANLYDFDAQLAYHRAVVVGGIVNSFTPEQTAYLSKMAFDDFSTWPDVAEDEALKRSLTQTEHVALMTYASELFSWYRGSLTADIYFCPERHGTYFGGFFLKDYPAMNNPDYFISTAVTGDLGAMFLDVLNADQRKLIEGIVAEQKPYLTEIVQVRGEICTALRAAMDGTVPDWETVQTLVHRYGELDGTVSCLYATRFSTVYQSLTEEQVAQLVALRNLSVVPDGAYAFSEPIPYPTLPNVDYLFGAGEMPSDAGTYSVPDGFLPDRQKGE